VPEAEFLPTRGEKSGVATGTPETKSRATGRGFTSKFIGGSSFQVELWHK